MSCVVSIFFELAIRIFGTGRALVNAAAFVRSNPNSIQSLAVVQRAVTGPAARLLFTHRGAPVRKNRRNRVAFRPELNATALEERVVLSLPPGYTFVNAQQAAQFRAAFSRALRSTEFSVRTEIQAEATQLFASGTPTPQQLATFEANAQGTVAAGTVALANMFALLPGSQRRLIPSTARALLANSQNSLMSRVANVVANANNSSSLANLENALTRNVRGVFGNVRARLHSS